MSEITREKPNLFDVEMQLEEQMAARRVARLVMQHKIHVLAKAIDAWK